MRRVRVLLRGLFAIVLVGSAVLFAVANQNAITINFYPLPFVAETRVFLVMLASMLGGAVLALLVSLPARIGRRRKMKAMRLRTDALENEVAVLKAERQLSTPPSAV